MHLFRRTRGRDASIPLDEKVQYVPFMYRLGASIADLALMAIVVVPLIFAFAGGFEAPGPAHAAIVISVAFVYLVPVMRWKSRSLGQWLISARTVDVASSGTPALWQFVLRFAGILLSLLAGGIGLFWAGWNRRRRGWPDYLARTAVVGDGTFRPLTEEERTNIADTVTLGNSHQTR